MHLVDGQDRACRHACGFQLVEPVLCGLWCKVGGQCIGQRLPVLHAGAVGFKTRIIGQLLGTDHFQHTFPVGLVGCAKVEPAILGLERFIGCIQWVRRAHGAGRDAGGETDR